METDRDDGVPAPVGWGDIATRADLEHFAIEPRSEMGEPRAELAVKWRSYASNSREHAVSDVGAYRTGQDVSEVYEMCAR